MLNLFQHLLLKGIAGQARNDELFFRRSLKIKNPPSQKKRRVIVINLQKIFYLQNLFHNLNFFCTNSFTVLHFNKIQTV